MQRSPFAILIISLVLAHLLIFASFTQAFSFWILFSLTAFILVVIAVMFEKMPFKGDLKPIIGYGLTTGLFLYLLFAVGKLFLDTWDSHFLHSLAGLYELVTPISWWQIGALMLVVIPGEELFWRGYVQTQFSRYMSTPNAILLSAAVYTTAQISSGSMLLVFASLVGGIFFGALYAWKHNMTLLILSHLTFDTLLLFILPLI